MMKLSQPLFTPLEYECKPDPTTEATRGPTEERCLIMSSALFSWIFFHPVMLTAGPKDSPGESLVCIMEEEDFLTCSCRSGRLGQLDSLEEAVYFCCFSV
mmetsp:Transcript_92744/g.170171  ORF Transcript_92744/g.170171 Transcript_92744/m.170171 type:complete len:100 (-) Transcript_92744:830-1129(-)